MSRYQTATARAHASREATKTAIGRELMWAAIGSRLWPSYLFKPKTPQQSFPALVCIESPAGPIIYRLAADEVELFAHVTDRRTDGPAHYQMNDKVIALLHLATEGF